MIRFIFALLITTSIAACESSEDNSRQKPIAKVYDFTLYDSDLKGITSRTTNSNDSAQLANAYIDRWVRDKISLHHAERLQPLEVDIEKLVADYHHSLLIHYYEEQLIESQLDTSISAVELKQYYNEHQQDFILTEDLVIASAFKNIDRKALKELKEVLNKNNWQKDSSILLYFRQIFTVTRFTTALKLPNLKTEENQWIEDKENERYYYIHQRVRSGKVAPMDYVSSKIRSLIIQKKKSNLIDEISKQHYQEALRKGYIKYY